MGILGMMQFKKGWVGMNGEVIIFSIDYCIGRVRKLILFGLLSVLSVFLSREH